MKYFIQRAASAPALRGDADHPAWSAAQPAVLEHFHARSSDHHPRVAARMLWDESRLYVAFRCEDRYVRSVSTHYQGPTCRDSCVELFIAPVAGKGYFNFEFSAGGTLLLYYIEDSTRVPGGFARQTPVSRELADTIEVCHSLPAVVEPEIADAVTWSLRYAVPWSLMAHYVGPFAPKPGTIMHGNLFKCADGTSHPHWASWSPIGEQLNFHQPKYFGELTLSA